MITRGPGPESAAEHQSRLGRSMRPLWLLMLRRAWPEQRPGDTVYLLLVIASAAFAATVTTVSAARGTRAALAEP
jgi:hypothetical protein